MKDILLIGSNGYIGSALSIFLGERVRTIDICGNPEHKINYKKLSKKYIRQYKNIILLAANSSVASCDGDAVYSFNNNVSNFVNLLEKIDKSQKLIYASSASVYGDTENQIVNEAYDKFSTINYYDLTKYINDCYASLSDLNYYGLRFGTVNGKIKNSNIVRQDVIINAMTKNAIEDKKITCVNPDVNRAILGINDLCNSVLRIVEMGNDKNKGVYNLASFNTTVGEIATFVGNKYNAEIDIKNNNNNKLYNFKLDTSKFKNQFNIEFKDTIESICNSIESDFENIEFVRRDACLKI